MDPIQYNLDAELQIRVGEELLANAKRIELLRQLGQWENLTKAAKLTGYSYKGAWDAIDQMTTLSGGELIQRYAGGKGGGSTKLTQRAIELLKNFTLIQDEHRRFIGRLNKLAYGLADDYATRAEIAMKTSVRNQYAGIIVSILQGPVSDEIDLLVSGSQIITASITHESCRELQLDIGSKVFALIKASSITISEGNDYLEQHAGKNHFPATVQSIIRGKQTSEVIMTVGDGLDLVSTLSNASFERLSLKPGTKIIAKFDPSAVIIGIAA